MRSRAWVALCAAGLLVGLRAAAVDPDARGWTRGGVVAAQSAQLMAGHASRDEVELPRDVVKKVEGPTVLVYFSPTCPHCMAVAAELEQLSGRLRASGQGRLVGIASGSSTPETKVRKRALKAFEAAISGTFPG